MRNKELFDTLFKLYRELILKHKFSKAQKILDQLKFLYPSNGWYHQGLLTAAQAFYKKKFRQSIPKQIACFKKSLEYNPHYESAWRALGVLYMEIKQYVKAEEAFQNSLRYSRNDIFRGDALRLLANVALTKGNTKKALYLLNKIFKLKKRPPYFQLAGHFIKYYQKVGNQQKVNEWAKKGIMSARIVEKSGKQAYEDKDAYKKTVEKYQAYIK